MTLYCGRSWPGLGKVPRLKTEPGLIGSPSCGVTSLRFAVSNVSIDVSVRTWSKFAMDNVGELAASEARRLVALNFNSGAKTEVLGGECRTVLENPSPTFCTFSELACGDSSAIS